MIITERKDLDLFKVKSLSNWLWHRLFAAVRASSLGCSGREGHLFRCTHLHSPWHMADSVVVWAWHIFLSLFFIGMFYQFLETPWLPGALTCPSVFAKFGKLFKKKKKNSALSLWKCVFLFAFWTLHVLSTPAVSCFQEGILWCHARDTRKG